MAAFSADFLAHFAINLDTSNQAARRRKTYKTQAIRWYISIYTYVLYKPLRYSLIKSANQKRIAFFHRLLSFENKYIKLLFSHTRTLEHVQEFDR